MAFKPESGLPEIKNRSIATIYSKIKAKLLTVDEIVNSYFTLPGILLEWINENKDDLHRDTLDKILEIFKKIAEVLSFLQRNQMVAKFFQRAEQSSFC